MSLEAAVTYVLDKIVKVYSEVAAYLTPLLIINAEDLYVLLMGLTRFVIIENDDLDEASR